ncbi:hypothetical protein M8J77_020768 [Diaphorina citri]|nr:hypothetical protein M8J77_020768 [Diaphorina citri]
MYADDLKIFRTVSSKTDCELLQQDLNSVQKWLETIGLHFHPNKCFKMSYSSKKMKLDHPYYIEGTQLQEVESYSDLGVILSNNLSWRKHIDDVTVRAYRKLGMIIRFCKPIQDADAILLLYKSIVRSTLEYCSVLWNPETKSDTKKIEDVQASFVRYLFQKLNGFYPKYPQNIGYSTLIENIPMESIETRFENNQIKLLRDVLTNKINSPNITSNITFKIPDNRLRIDPSKLFEVSNNKTMLKSPTMFAMNTYNNMEPKPDIFTPQTKLTCR